MISCLSCIVCLVLSMAGTMDLEGVSLLTVLTDHEYALGLSPGFFRFYALTGILYALEEKSCLHPTHISGSSAGAMVGGFYAAGLEPSDMVKSLFSIKRTDVWDMGGIGGLLQGKLFHDILTNILPVRKIEECRIPFGTTAYNLFTFRTKLIHSGCIATAIRASCTFPGLFQPVIIDDLPHVDGGVWDDSGLMALPGMPSCGLIVNVVCGEGRRRSSYLPVQYAGSQLLTIVMKNVPMVSPFSMATMGPMAFSIAREATLKALQSAVVTRRGEDMWECAIDGAGIVPTETLKMIETELSVIHPSNHKRRDHDHYQRDGHRGDDDRNKTADELEVLNEMEGIESIHFHQKRRKRRRKYIK